MLRSRLLGGFAALSLVALGGAAPEDGFSSLFDGTGLSEWKIPEGDNGHWRVIDGTDKDGKSCKVLDYDARSEAKGEKHLVSNKEFGDFVLRLEWRIKETPYQNPNVPYVLPDGTHARGVDGKELKFTLPDSDSGVYLRDMTGKSQVNIWCWPIGSGEVYGYRTDPNMSARVRRAVTPRHQADKPVGEWNEFEIALKEDQLTVVLNGVIVIHDAHLPGIPARGPIALQHHGGYQNGKYTGPPALVQFRNIRIRELK